MATGRSEKCEKIVNGNRTIRRQTHSQSVKSRTVQLYWLVNSPKC